MSDTRIEDAIIQSIRIIAEQKIAQANFDRTYIGIVSKVVDQTTGTYEIRYQDSVLTAYATSPDVYYKVGQEVYFLVPSNNMGLRKTIVGGVDQKATTYKEIVPVIEKYNRKGTNLIISFDENFGKLSSYKDEENFIIYRHDGGDNNKVVLNTEAIERYIKQGNGISIGMKVKTDLADSQVGGDYGMKILMRFTDAVTGAAAIRSYVVSSKDVIGNPYYLPVPSLVENFINDINIEEFDRIEEISLFNNDFPLDPIKAQSILDIFISDLQIYAGVSLTSEQLNGYSLNIDASENGTVLSEDVESTKLVAQLKVNGKIVTKDVVYYWFRQNGMIFRGSEKYSGYGGNGWECLNYFPNTTPLAREQADFEINTKAEDFPKEGKAAALQKVNKILCVAVFQNELINSEIEIINKNSHSVLIQSSDKKEDKSNKTIYYLDNGSPTLTCIIEATGDFIYTWSVVPANGKAQKRLETTDLNDRYIAYENEYNTQTQKLNKKSGKSKTEYADTTAYKTAVQNWENIQKEERIDKNTYVNFPVSSINNYSKIICAVTKEDGTYMGSGSIILYNKTELQGVYSLSLENGTQVFQYDGKGNSPTSPQLEKPLEIRPLTFTLIDNTGKQIPHDQIRNNGHIKWIIPEEQTLLLSIDNGEGKQGTDDLTVNRADLPLPASSYRVYSGNDSFNYAIADRYDSKNNINYIWIHVKFKDMQFDTYTDFTFPKDGDPGTNGTDYVVKLTTPFNSQRVYISNKQPSSLFDDQGNDFDKLNFLVYNNSNEVKPAPSAIWSCPPKGNNKDTINQSTYLNCNNGVITLNGTGSGTPNISNIKSAKPVNIVRTTSTIADLKHYAEFPVCYNQVIDRKYRIKVTPKTGYKYVVYSQDGSRPDYDNTMPFKVYAEVLNGDYWEVLDSNITYSWDVMGNLSISGVRNTQQCTVIPKETFNGEDLSSAIFCTVKQNNTTIGFIHIPIYMMINRYGHKALNDWDGNSIQLNDKKHTILSPQVGAGKKDDRNRFTGVLMGDIKQGNNTKTGLVGYHEGQRSIFLDANTGNAYFGKDTQARINIGASSVGIAPKGSIYSGNYYNYNDNGQPVSLKSEGMLIDLITPQIRFGSGDFYVTKEGHIHAAGNGDIAGWNIDDNKIYKNNTGMSSQVTKVSDIDPSKTRPNQNSTVAFYAGQRSEDDTQTSPNFYVTHAGYLYSKSGKIASWNIDDKQISNKNVGMGTGKNINANTFLNQPNNINNSRFWAGTGVSDNDVTFAVTADGKMYCKSAQIASWSVDKDKLTSGNMGMGSGGKYTVGGKNTKFNAVFWSQNNFAVDEGGNLYSAAGYIGGWEITGDQLKGGNTIINSNGSLSNSGTGSASWSINADGSSTFTNITCYDIDAISGKIGNYEIKKGQLSNGNVTLTSDGQLIAKKGNIGAVTIYADGIRGTGFDINGKGANFNNGLTIDGNKVKTGGAAGGITGGGGSWTGGGLSGSGGGGSWSFPSGGKPTFTYDNYTMTPQEIKVIKKLALKVAANGFYLPTGITDVEIPDVGTVTVISSYVQVNQVAKGWTSDTALQKVEALISKPEEQSAGGEQ